MDTDGELGNSQVSEDAGPVIPEPLAAWLICCGTSIMACVPLIAWAAPLSKSRPAMKRSSDLP